MRGPRVVAAASLLTLATTGCAQRTAPSMTPMGTQSTMQIERDRAECEAVARRRTPSRWEIVREMLVPQALGLAAGAAAGGAAVGARRGQLEGSVSPRATTDITIIITSVTVGFVLGSVVGLARAAATSQEATEGFQRDFADCMATRGYR